MDLLLNLKWVLIMRISAFPTLRKKRAYTHYVENVHYARCVVGNVQVDRYKGVLIQLDAERRNFASLDWMHFCVLGLDAFLCPWIGRIFASLDWTHFCVLVGRIFASLLDTLWRIYMSLFDTLDAFMRPWTFIHPWTHLCVLQKTLWTHFCVLVGHFLDAFMRP